MSWRVALGEPDPALRALAGERELVPIARAEVVLWPARRRGPLPVGAVLNVIDLRDVAASEEVALAGAGLLLVGSAAAYGAWAARGVEQPIGVVPAVVEVAALASERFAALHLLVGPGEAEAAEGAARWAAARGMACGVAEGSLAQVARFGAAPPLAPGAVVLDLRTGAGRIEASAALRMLLAIGAPVLFEEDTPLRATLESAGAGWRAEAVEAGLDFVAGLGTAAFGRASEAALRFARARFRADGAQAAFERAVDGALARLRARMAAWERPGPGGHVLVVSDEGSNLRHVRVHQPFDALVRRQAIAGYSVLHRGQLLAGAAPVAPETRFSAIWVQRSVDPLVQLFLRVLDQPFVYDLDDNLLVSPAYRRAFSADAMATAAGLVRDCAVLSCATGRLAAALPGAGAKGIVTPNLAYAGARRVAGAARAVVWASSDTPALLGSRVEIERAIRDFCRTHDLKLVCIGEQVPAAFEAAGIAVEALGHLAYPAYLERLAGAAPGILVAPLETRGDGATQAFVDAKSDIKVIEAAIAGLQGVFSRAAPYADSDLAPDHLCENTYEGWIAGLERARLACEQPGQAAAWPGRRDAAGTGLMPWAAALGRARADVSGAEISAALRFVAAQAETLVGTPAAFDEADYLQRHPDVAEAVAAGMVESGYRHFVQFGLREGRAARRRATAEGERSFWWARLLHKVSGLEEEVAARAREIAGLRDRVAIRRLLPDPVTPQRADAAPQGGWLRWPEGERRALPCPICEAAGPHAVAVEASGQRLLRCGQCGTCFYEDRTEHEYAVDAAADVALQFALEQNAGIYHQTRLLFGREGAGSVLDVGCGFGFAVDLAATVLGWRAVGIDPSWAAAAGREQLGADIRQEYLTEASELGDGFDRVIASEVIEHVADPYAMLALLRARLTPGGVLAVTTPNAAAIGPGVDGGRLLGILAPGVHLTLFTESSLGLALRQAGFGHVAVEATADTLVAEASDWPLGARAAGGHGAAYRRYLEGLMERAAPGSALWNGAAGRLLALLTPTAERGALLALFEAIGAAWRERFGFDLERLPDPLSEAEVRTIGARALGQRQPFNLASVLLQRALNEPLGPAALGYAEAACRVAVETGRVLQAENLVDLDLKQTAWRAQHRAAACLAAMAPGLGGALVQAVAAGSPEGADWADAPEAAVLELVAGFFAGAVAADQFGEARRVEAWVEDADRLVAALEGQTGLLLQTLFMRGVQRLVGHGDAAGALLAFERLAQEARRLGAADYGAIAEEHMALAAARLAPSAG
ncbi:MAG: class I SAM-dependent methyltransferase [Acetobacteraceae bacterium]|nr:class I SAM-dependent methyltransferase [Acetobacteraceae bacterium]